MTTVDSAAQSRAAASVSLADEDAVKRVLADTLFGLWAHLTRLRPSRRERYRVTVFGSIAVIRERHARWKVAQGTAP